MLQLPAGPAAERGDDGGPFLLGQVKLGLGHDEPVAKIGDHPAALLESALPLPFSGPGIGRFRMCRFEFRPAVFVRRLQPGEFRLQGGKLAFEVRR